MADKVQNQIPDIVDVHRQIGDLNKDAHSHPGMVGTKILRALLEDNIHNSVPFYSTFTLSPNGVASSGTINADGTPTTGATVGYTDAVAILVTDNRNVGIIQKLSIDTIPGAVAVQFLSTGYNFGSMGTLGTSSNLTNSRWIGDNIFPTSILMLVGRTLYLNIGFTNITNYNVQVNVNSIVGFIDKAIAQDILDFFNFGKKIV